jgi:YfiH family protein
MSFSFTESPIPSCQEARLCLSVCNAFKEFPGLVHGFTTREGGSSSGYYSSLNLGYSVGDSEAAVRENWEQLFCASDTVREQWALVNQVHGTRIITVNAPEEVQTLRNSPPAADGLITGCPDIVLGVKLADCVPVLLVSPRKRTAAAVHAGWKGTVQGIAFQAAVELMKQSGVNPDELHAAIGPSIGPCCFEVQEDVAAHFPEFCKREVGDRWLVDLWKTNELQLLNAGLKPEHVHVSRMCTVCDNEHFFSHRRDKGKTGRMVAFVGWKE